jgi:hypothetical protein
MRKRTRLAAVSLAVLATSVLWHAVPARAADTAIGKRLHEAHCASCHAGIVGGDGSKLYTRESRRIHSFPGLERQVERCVQSRDLNWSKAQINDVIAYLNQTYYHFKE